jgi:hypothetical protein
MHHATVRDLNHTLCCHWDKKLPRCIISFRCMPLAHVEALSDDDGALVQPAEGPLVPSVSRKRLLPGDRSVVSFAQLAAVRQRLHRTVNSTCRCCRKVSPKHPDKKNCFAPFRGETMFGEIVSLRKTLLSMCKFDADQKVLRLWWDIFCFFTVLAHMSDCGCILWRKLVKDVSCFHFAFH